MGALVVSGATITCTFGTAPAALNVTSQSVMLAEGKPAATIKDCAGMINISNCGMCTSMSNPAVAAATAAALGVLTPQPCIPACAGSWLVTAGKVLIGGTPCLSNNSVLLCSYGGNLSIKSAGQSTVMV